MDTWIRFNPHPKDKNIGDCVKRTFVKALNMEYMEVQRYLNSIKKKVHADKYNENKVWQEVIKQHNMIKLSYPAIKGQPRMNGHRFAEQHPKGTYILRMAGHLATCENGVIYDSWDSRDKCVYNAYKVK
jgi:hypothetical protein